MGRKLSQRVNVFPPPAESGKTLRHALAGKTMETLRMNFARAFRLALVALIPIAAISLGVGNALAQSPPAPPAARPPPPPPPSAPPAPPPAEPKPPADPPSAAQTPATPPAAAPVQT